MYKEKIGEAVVVAAVEYVKAKAVPENIDKAVLGVVKIIPKNKKVVAIAAGAAVVAGGIYAVKKIKERKEKEAQKEEKINEIHEMLNKFFEENNKNMEEC